MTRRCSGKRLPTMGCIPTTPGMKSWGRSQRRQSRWRYDPLLPTGTKGRQKEKAVNQMRVFKQLKIHRGTHGYGFPGLLNSGDTFSKRSWRRLLRGRLHEKEAQIRNTG